MGAEEAERSINGARDRFKADAHASADPRLEEAARGDEGADGARDRFIGRP